MADEPPAGGDGANGGVHYVNENQFKNMKLSIGALGNTIFEVSLSKNLNDTENIDIRLHQNNGPQAAGAGGAAAAPVAADQPAPHNEPQAQSNMAQGQGGAADNQVPAAPAEQQGAPAPPLGANAEPGEAAPPQGRLKITVAAEHDADKEYLDKMRGWLMTVATLFVGISFQAMLHPPDWLKMEWVVAPSLKKHAGKAGSPLAAPAPSPSPSPAGPTTGESWRALLYLLSNLVTFAIALTVVQLLLSEAPSPRRTMTSVRRMVRILSYFLAFTFALGTADSWVLTVIVCVGLVVYAVQAVLMISPGKVRQRSLFLRLRRRAPIQHPHVA